jgi:predicted nucleic acid-binding protein
MIANSFVDSNILIYVYDVDAKEKHEIAVAVIKKLWETKTGIISTQVLQEFYVNVTRKIAKPLSLAVAREIMNDYLSWQVVNNTPETILLASEIQERHLLSFWDSLIIAAAKQSSATTLLTEDLNHGQIIEGIRIENPFLTN